eukprot:5749477-Amphidinium_carterae.1
MRGTSREDECSWSDKSDGTGYNLRGLFLMQLREELLENYGLSADAEHDFMMKPSQCVACNTSFQHTKLCCGLGMSCGEGGLT